MRFVLVVLLTLGLASAQDLFAAAESGSPEDVAAALAAGGDPSAVDEEGDTPLLVAVRHNRAAVVRALLAAGADPSYVNPRTGLGIFGLVWRNPNGAEIRALFTELGLVPHVGPPERAAADRNGDLPDDASADGEPAAPAFDADPVAGDQGRGADAGDGGPAGAAGGGDAAAPVEEVAAPTALEPYRPPLALDRAAALGFVVDEDDPTTVDDVDYLVVDVTELRTPLVPQAFVLACRSAVLQVIRAPETATFGLDDAVAYNAEGIMRHETQLLTRNAAGVTVRFSVTCTGFVDAGTLNLAVEVAAR